MKEKDKIKRMDLEAYNKKDKKLMITVLQRASNLLETKGWIKRTEAVDKDGNEVPNTSKKAVKFCAYGALDAAKNRISSYIVTNTVEVLEGYLNGDLTSWNDKKGRTKTQVIHLFNTVTNILLEH